MQAVVRSSRTIQEEIDELADEGINLHTGAQSAGRSMTATEERRFFTISETLVPTLKKELTAANLREDRMRMAAVHNQGVDMSGATLQPVLPVNGDLPSGANARVRLRPKKLNAFQSESDAYDSGMWLRAMLNQHDETAHEHCRRRGLDIYNAAGESTGVAGGYTVPTPLAQTIIDVREELGVARRACRIVPMSADTLTIPKVAGGLTAYVGSENPTADMTDSDKQWGAIELVAKKRYVATFISQELSEDSLISITDDAAREMARALALKEDQTFIDGDASATYGGVTGIKNAIGDGGVHTAGSGDDTWDELAIEDFTGTMGKLPSQYHGDSTAWICSSEFFHSVMLRVAVEGGGNTLGMLFGGAGGAPMFLGKPVYFTSLMPTATEASTVHAFFGNFADAVVLGERTGVMVKRSDDFKFLTDQITLKATARWDMKVHEAGDGSTAGAYVALKTAS